MRPRTLPSTVTAVLALLFTACSDPAGPGDVQPITQLPRSLSVAEQEVIARSNTFGLELLRAVVADDERPNVVLSPLSASMALGMTLNGARAGTFDAMSDALGFEGLDQDEINASYRDLIELLTGLDPNVRFKIANAIFANEEITFRDAFFAAVRDAFDAAAASRDFSDPATLQEINAWVDEQTEGLIDRILDDLDPELAMLLLNAIYFEGAWTTQFDPEDTAPGTFETIDGGTVSVPMMKLTEAEVALGGGNGYQAAELPYGGGAFAMTLVVPTGDPRGFVAGLTDARWSEITGSLGEPTDIDLLSIPKLRLSYDTFLNDALRDLGMAVAFTDQADFSGMTEEVALCVDFVRQKTFLEVDEVGTKAAAVTAVGIRPTSFNGLVADRPFVLAIRERLSGTLLFVGLVGDPSVEDSGEPDPQQGC
ncbi:MAG: serpin family protein [Gemmatimonadota bacterium]